MERTRVVHNSTYVKRQSVILLITTEAMFSFKIWTEDVSQAYLHGESFLIRKLYIELKRNIIL